MISRRLPALLAIVLFIAIVSINASEPVEEKTNAEVEARNPGLALAMGIVKQIPNSAGKYCIKEAAENCKQHWKNPGKLARCARGYMRSKKGRCIFRI